MRRVQGAGQGTIKEVQSGKIRIFCAVFISGNKIAFRFLFRELGHDLTWCEKGYSGVNEKRFSPFV